MLLGATGGRSAIPKQAPVPLIAECALSAEKRTTEPANRVSSLLGPSPWPTNREQRCTLRSDDTEASSRGVARVGRGDRRVERPEDQRQTEPRLDVDQGLDQLAAAAGGHVVRLLPPSATVVWQGWYLLLRPAPSAPACDALAAADQMAPRNSHTSLGRIYDRGVNRGNTTTGTILHSGAMMSWPAPSAVDWQVWSPPSCRRGWHSSTRVASVG